jgi:hypothetical protein
MPTGGENIQSSDAADMSGLHSWGRGMGERGVAERRYMLWSTTSPSPTHSLIFFDEVMLTMSSSDTGRQPHTGSLTHG